MRTPAMIGEAPRNLRWSADGSLLRFSWAKPDGSDDPRFKEYAVHRDGTGLGPAPAPAKEDGLAQYDERANGKAVYEDDGDIFLIDLATGKSQNLTKTDARESEPQFMPGGQSIVFLRGGDPYRMDLNGTTVQLAHLVLPPPPPNTASATPQTQANDQALAKEQTSLLKSFSPSGIRASNGGGFRRGGFGGITGSGATGGVAVDVPASGRLANISLSPSAKAMSFQLTVDAPSPRGTEVPSYATRSGYTEMLPSYPKVGYAQRRDGIRFADLSTGKTVAFEAPRPSVIGSVRWSPDGLTGVFSASANDHKDRWIVGYDVTSGKISILWDEHDDAWVGGPGAGMLDWTPQGRIAFESEKNGYANLLTMAADGSDLKPLVVGPFEVSDVTMDREHGRFVFVSSEGSPFKRHVDTVPLTGGPVTKLADLSADEDAAYAISPDGKDIAVVRSSPARPAELWVNNVQVTHTPTDEWLKYPWIEAPIVMVPSRDGQKIPAKLYKPKNWRKGGPAVIFVHGAGYLQNVYEGWSHYFRETMFNQLLMSKGYAVLDMDYRASAGYGKAWRTAIYRNMGGKDLDDNVDGAQYLVKELGANPKRLGLYGGSYGGFITLMAMFKTPDVFAAGAALRPVADWANYNHGYTSPILNDPQDDPEAYRRSSPIYFAEGLKGSLLICHGMVDTNVHFQDTVRLTERLIELGKDNWEVAPYPVENHAFTEVASWTDEYKRILALFERTIGPGWRKK